jgi:hypothetical protein
LLLVAEQASLAGVGIEAEHANPRTRDAEVLGERAGEQ